MEKHIVHIFGNPDISMDALPLLMIPRLQSAFPDIEFRPLDPNEEWEIPDPFIIIDVAVGLSDVHVFHDLDEFARTPSVSMHDFDALTQLRYLKKLGKLGRVIIIGIPPEMTEEDAEERVKNLLHEVLTL